MEHISRWFGKIQVIPIKGISALFIKENEDTPAEMIKLTGDTPADRYLRSVFGFDNVSSDEHLLRTIKNIQEFPEPLEAKESDTYIFDEKVKVTVLENDEDSSLTAILSFDGEKNFRFQINDPLPELEIVLAFAKKIAMARKRQ